MPKSKEHIHVSEVMPILYMKGYVFKNTKNEFKIDMDKINDISYPCSRHRGERVLRDEGLDLIKEKDLLAILFRKINTLYSMRGVMALKKMSQYVTHAMDADESFFTLDNDEVIEDEITPKISQKKFSNNIASLRYGNNIKVNSARAFDKLETHGFNRDWIDEFDPLQRRAVLAYAFQCVKENMKGDEILKACKNEYGDTNE